MKKIIGQLKPYVPEEPAESVKARLGVDRLVRLSANENPYGTSPKVREAVLDYVVNNDANLYPDGNASALRAKLANYWNVEENQLVIGVGLDEVISMVNKTFINAGDSIVISVPAFSEYGLNGLVEGAVIREVPCIKATGQYDFGAMRKAVDDTTRLVWICNPNNPTGTYESVEDIRKFIGTLPDNVLVIIDEAYIDFVTFVEVPTARALLDEFPNVCIMRTFSKAYGLANYRVGYMMSSAELANYIQTIRLPYNLNTLSQVAAEAAFEDQEFLRATVRKNAVERDLWEQTLDEVKATYYKSGANFIFITNDGTLVTPKSDSILPSITRRSLMYVAEHYLGMKVEHRPVHKDELKDFAEMGLCGTAAVISPVGQIDTPEGTINVPAGMEDMGPMTKKLYDTLLGIQHGEIEAPEGWVVTIC